MQLLRERLAETYSPFIGFFIILEESIVAEYLNIYVYITIWKTIIVQN